MPTSPLHDWHVRQSYKKQRHAEKLKQFKDYQSQPELKIKHRHVSGDFSHEIYLKKTVRLKAGQSLDIITNQNLTHDTTLLFRTDGEGVTKLLKMGLLRPQTPTSKAIKTLGQYRKKNWVREVKSRIESTLRAEKEVLLDRAQERIEQLQDLELHLGHPVYPHTAMLVAEQMVKDLDQYCKKQKLSSDDEKYKAEIVSDRSERSQWPWITHFHDVRIRSLETANEGNIAAANVLKMLIQSHQDDAEWLRTTGNEEILEFIKGRIISTTREMQGLNQVLTHMPGSRAYLRGHLNNYDEETLKLEHDYRHDFRTPVTLAHQLRDPDTFYLMSRVPTATDLDEAKANGRPLFFKHNDIISIYGFNNAKWDFTQLILSQEQLTALDAQFSKNADEKKAIERQNADAFLLQQLAKGHDFAAKKWIVDSDVHTNGSLSELEDLMLGVSIVAGDNSILNERRGPVKKTIAVKWRHWRSFYDFNKPYTRSVFTSGKRFRAWIWESLLSPFNLVETAIRGNKAHYFQDQRKRYPKEENQVGDNTDYYALTARLSLETSISTKIGLELYKIANYLFVDGLWHGLKDGWKQIKSFPDDVRGDFTNLKQDLPKVLEEFQSEARKLETSDQELLGHGVALISLDSRNAIHSEESLRERNRLKLNCQNIKYPIVYQHGHQYYVEGNISEGPGLASVTDRKHIAVLKQLFLNKSRNHSFKLVKKGSYYVSRELNSLLLNYYKSPSSAVISQAGFEKNQLEEKKPEEIAYAQPEFSLNHYQSHGILNSGVTGLIEFVDLFGQHMFANHPFTSTVSLLCCVFSFMAFFTPDLAIQLFGKGYVKFLQDQGYIWTSDLLSASTAGAFTNFKLVGAIIEFLMHGPDSWASRYFSHLINDPARSITFVTLAWLIGHTLVFWLDVPGLSEELKAHIGNPPVLSEVFGGAKIGIICYELLVSRHEDREALRKNLIEQCVENYLVSERKLNREPDSEQVKHLRACLGKAISWEWLGQIDQRIKEADAVPRTEAEIKKETMAREKLALMMQLAAHKDKLPRLSPALKAKLEYQVEKYAYSSADAAAINKYFDPERAAPKSTLRSFLGRTISYVPTLIRCLLSPLARPYTGSWDSAKRPWKELGSMLRDDFVSTSFALLRFVNKFSETVFNRFPRTFADIAVNGVIGRTLSFFGHHDFTLAAYRASAKADQLQEKICESTTGLAMTKLAWANTTPHPGLSLGQAVNEASSVLLDDIPPPLIRIPIEDENKDDVSRVLRLTLERSQLNQSQYRCTASDSPIHSAENKPGQLSQGDRAQLKLQRL